MLWCFFLRACLFILVARIVEKVPLVGSKKYLLDTHYDDFFAVLRRETKKNISLTFSNKKSKKIKTVLLLLLKLLLLPFFLFRLKIQQRTLQKGWSTPHTTHTHTHTHRQRERERALSSRLRRRRWCSKRASRAR